jgi:hypothetical protein
LKRGRLCLRTRERELKHPSMYEKVTKEVLKTKYSQNKDDVFHEFTINETRLICNSRGLLFRQMKTGYWKEIKNTKNHAKGYNVILVKNKQYSRAKLILFAFNKINLDDKHKNIYHKNMNRLDCQLNNLTLDVPHTYKPNN